jgi:hypothetical protein
MNLYQTQSQSQTNPYASKHNRIIEPATQSYHNITNQYNYIPTTA